MPRGGARPNTAPKGPFDKLKAHMRLQELYWQSQERITQAQIEAAAGLKYLVARNKKGGKFTHLTEEGAKAILSGQDTENEIVEEWEKLPNPQAFAYLTDQALGRPAQAVEVKAEHSGGLEIVWKTSE